MIAEIIYNVSAFQLIVIGIICLFVPFYWGNKRQNLPPGPTGWPFIGNILLLASGNPAEVLAALKPKYGNLVYLKLGRLRAVVLQDYAVMREAFVEKSDKTSARPGSIGEDTKLFGDSPKGVIFTIGEEFKKMKKLTMMALRDSDDRHVSIEDKICEESAAMLELLLSQSSAFASEELRDYFGKAASNVIMSICFGQRCEYDDQEFQSVLKSMETLGSVNPLGQPSNLFPILKYIPLIKDQMPVFLQEQNKVKNYMRERVIQHRQTYDPGNIRDFTDLFFKEKHNEENINFEEKDDSLFGLIMELVMAGSETTATTISWIIFFLAKFPDKQDRLLSDIKQVIGFDRKPKYQDHNKLPYVDAFICETLRIGNVAPLGVPRIALEDFTLNGFLIPRETLLISNLQGLHMDEGLWNKPQEFNPNRFLDENGQLKRVDAFQPFSFGSRSCLGEQLAKMEAFLLLTSLLQQLEFRFEDPSIDYPIHGVLGLMRRPLHHRIHIQKRSCQVSQ